jgi:hypothetical protein
MLSHALSELDGKAELTTDDAIAVRRIVFGGDCMVSADEAEALIQLNADAGQISAEWRALFIEALSDYVVRQEHPQGYVDAAKGDWLLTQMRRRQSLREDEVEMLIHVLEQADQTPEEVSGFVVDRVKSAALAGVERNGRLDPMEIERLRRVVFAAGGTNNIAVSRREAEALFDINDALNGAAPDPAWADLFVRAVGNSVLYKPPWKADAAAEVARETWIEDASIHPLRRLAALGKSRQDLSGMLEALREIVHWDFDDHAMDQALAADALLEANAEAVTADEAHWLVERIRKNARFDVNERALLTFIRANADTIDPSFIEAMRGLESPPAFGRRKRSAA